LESQTNEFKKHMSSEKEDKDNIVLYNSLTK
jgi:hypothetical protein